MDFVIKHQIKGRLRIICCRDKGQAAVRRFSLRQADIITYYLERCQGVRKVKVYDRTASIAVEYDETQNSENKNELLAALRRLDLHDSELNCLVPVPTSRELNRSYQNKLLLMIGRHFFCKWFLPIPLRTVLTACRTLRFVKRACRSLAAHKLDVAVLDASAVSASMLRRDIDTAGSVIFLLGVGELLEEWTYRKSVDDLARSMSLNIKKVWLQKDGREQEVSLDAVQKDDLVAVKMGAVIPLDGVVVAGEALVNQASLTGEALAVRKESGITVYAGTVVEEGEIVVRVAGRAGETRYEQIIKMIEASEKLKSTVESNAMHLADKLVPYSLLGTILVYGLTGNVTKAMSILMVDFSCALKLSMPLAVLSAMRECSTHKITVKGGKFLEAVAEADTIVFDKTGTLTKAQPTVADIITFNGYDRKTALTYAACLEEHFPHSVANAIVRQAEKEGLSHEEMHTKVEYIVAHGIVSHVNGLRIVIGSGHFVFDDENCIVPAGEEERYNTCPPEYSHIYMAVGGVLSAVICISDPVRAEASEVIRALRQCGLKKIVMMTGDNRRTAANIAASVGVDEFYAEVLPADKARYIEQVKLDGSKVIMVGDGINDSPALSASDVGIAIAEGADIAREVADITVAANDLRQLVVLKQLSQLLLRRINGNYNFVVSFNLGLIMLGVGGMITPATSALLHNLSTISVGLHSMTDLLSAKGAEKTLPI